ncbi:hypothetical protein Q5H93_03115 [Hymenobacter sp. ASUV-10]|uniref:Uncharacterized protein n=1 Tax=Hymenobacter aranciens TaxID=3063996 RepID=A0ABT9B612_9BACT|nr:hypothetical protein [Hymenobacter sp. ASUV-10]MDO7873709.1 hypothetical protein [Hymenobacter sp. ASUV-10]
MADFLTGFCQNGSPSDTILADPLFGICDDPTPPGAIPTPAYINTDLTKKATWIARVNNSAGYEVTFKAVDHCILVLKANGQLQKRCDGILLYNAHIVFVELKEQKDPGRKWASEGAEQVKQTIKDYQAAHSTEGLTVRAYVANRIQPNAQQSHFSIIQNFRKTLRIALRIEGAIDL